MSTLDPFRIELRALLGPLPLVQRDRTMRALFICDAPRRIPEAPDLKDILEKAGYSAAQENGMWLMDLSPSRRIGYISSLSPGPIPDDAALGSLCRSLLSRKAVPAEDQPWMPIRKTLLYLDAGDRPGLIRFLQTNTALRKRRHAPLPAAAAYIIEETVCKEAPYADLSSCPQ